jgi:hypothetical protein
LIAAARSVQEQIQAERQEGICKNIHTRFINIPPFAEFLRTQVPTCEDIGTLIEFKGTVVVILIDLEDGDYQNATDFRNVSMYQVWRAASDGV